jgi:hypothetical protein
MTATNAAICDPIIAEFASTFGWAAISPDP